MPGGGVGDVGRHLGLRGNSVRICRLDVVAQLAAGDGLQLLDVLQGAQIDSQ
jgi:hypothetical protein